jgi:hypothetical protein
MCELVIVKALGAMQQLRLEQVLKAGLSFSMEVRGEMMWAAILNWSVVRPPSQAGGLISSQGVLP